MNQIIQYGNTEIKYEIARAERKTLAIEVHPDSSVLIKAPLEIDLVEIKVRVEKKASWIAKQQRFFEIYHRNTYKQEWVSGENIYYLGRQYRLKVIERKSSENKEEVKLSGKYLHVFIHNKDEKKQIEILVNSWYLGHAKIKFKERFKLLSTILEKEKLTVSSFKVRKLSKRWGSCSDRGSITLNSELIKVPINCIDYVLIHEICHLKHYNHSKKFWSMLLKYCPDWVSLKEKLEKFNF